MKQSILENIAQIKRQEINRLKSTYRLADFESMPLFNASCRSLTLAIRESDFGIIAEFKRKSPSAGIISEHADPKQVAKNYQAAGASGISCLTDPTFFWGSLDDLHKVRAHTTLPVLRKDFILDEIQLFEAKAHGADAVLLIAELLDAPHAKQLTIIAQSLGMEVIMEAHDRENLEKINDLVDIIGINNRNLHKQRTDIQTSINMRDFIPKHRICISESGVRNSSDLELLRKAEYHGALVGEALMKTEHPEVILMKSKVIC
jgi:indole-3-glycerol phosphate synthase